MNRRFWYQSMAPIRSLPHYRQALKKHARDACGDGVDFASVARKAVDGGADAVIPAEGLLSELLYANRVTTIDDATVLDCVGAALLHAEMLVSAKSRLGLGVGRRWAYVRPPAELLAELRAGKGPQE